MKSIISFPAVVLLLLWGISGLKLTGSPREDNEKFQVTESESVTLGCTPEVYKLTGSLVNAFNASHPGMKIHVVSQTQPSPEIRTLSLMTGGNISNLAGTPWKMSVAKDAVVPFMNAANPAMETLNREGLTSQEFARLLSGQDDETWESLVTNGAKSKVRLYIPGSEIQQNHLAAFSGVDASMLKGQIISSAGEMISAVQMDPLAVGFCRMSELTDPKTNAFYADIRVIPIDKNLNGRMDHFENIYADKEDFMHGVWLGKYPKSLCSGIFAVAPIKPEGKGELAFLEWVVSEGQQYLPSAGYSELTGIQQKAALEALAPLVVVTEVKGDTAHSNGWIVALLTLLVAGLMITPVLLVLRKKPVMLLQDLHVSAALNEASLSAPAGIFFDKTHTWAFMEKEGLVKMGIDDFLQHITGTPTRIIMKSPGEKIRKGEVAVTIVRDGKQLKLYAPVSGIIRKINRKLETDSTILNSSPYSEGWIYMIEPRNWLKDIHYMFMGEPYRNWLKEEIARLKDFFSAAGRKNSLVWSSTVLQDGGEIADHVLEDLGPDVWEEFQTEFIDASK